MVKRLVYGDVVSSLADDHDKLRFVVHFGGKVPLSLVSFRNGNLAVGRRKSGPGFEEKNREIRNRDICLYGPQVSALSLHGGWMVRVLPRHEQRN